MSPKILFIGSSSTNYEDLVKSFSGEKAQISFCSYHDLAFCIDEGQSYIKLFSTGEDIKSFDKIIVLATSPAHLQNYIFSALACYCRKYDVPILDDSFSNTDGKLYALWRFWEKNIPVAKTFFGSVDFLSRCLSSSAAPHVLKSVQGTKGRDNFLVHSEAELRQIIKQNPDVRFVMQDYIQNDGDWRIIVINFEPKLAIYRSSHGKDFRNNTSVGGEASLVSLDQVESNVLKLATDAAKALNIKIAGADILQDKTTGSYTVLEVNRTPQLVTGAFPKEKQRILRDLIYD